MGSFKGSPSALGASATVTNITVDGDLTLDDGGSIKEAGGVAAITVDGSGDIPMAIFLNGTMVPQKLNGLVFHLAVEPMLE